MKIQDSEALINALVQIAVLAEFNTTGPNTVPPCKSPPLNAAKATSLRGEISTIAREALSRVGR